MREEAGHDWLGELAAAVADGRVLDWDSLESSARTDDDRVAIRRLRAIAAIGHAHAELTFTDTASDSLSARTQLHGVDDPSAPTTWGSLRILDRVGRGRFGDVYRAWDPSLDREVALKLLRRRDIDPSSDLAVIEEGRLMARVRHPNVVTIHGAQRIDGRTGLWMEFVQGRTLEAELKDRGPFPASEVAQVGIELCRALAAVHQSGLVHRDVKAQNVLRETRGRTVLGDFGTGHELDDEGIGPTDIAGTPVYLAPEIFKRSAATIQSDLYSLGVLLFHLATGTYPVTGTSLQQIRDAHGRRKRAALATLRSDLPPALTEAIERALDSDPARRYQSAAAMEAALVSASDSGPDSASQKPARAMLLAATLFVGVAGAAIWTIGTRWGESGAASGSPGAVADVSPPGSRVYRYVGDANLAGPGAPSPDGRLVSMVLKGELGLHEVSTGKRWNLTGKESGDPPGYVEGSRFSLDGSRLTYIRFVLRPGGTLYDIPEIRSISSNGGQSRLIWRGEDNRYVNFYHWAGDDNLILVSRWPESGRGELLLIATDSGHILASHTLPSAPSLTGASLSPDARFAAFEQTDPVTGYPDIHVWSIGTDTSAPLIRDPASDDSPVWTTDGRYVLFMSNRSGDTGLWAQRVEDGRPAGAPTRLDPNIGTGAPMGGVTNAGALFMRRTIGTRDVFSVEVDPYTLRLLAEPKRVTDQPQSATGTSAWSPDGTHLAFYRRDGGRRSLVVRSMRDGREREFWRPGVEGIILPRWEPGGRSVLFKASIDQRQGLHRLDLDTGMFTTVLERGLNEYEPLPTPGMIVLSDRRTNAIVRVDLVTGREEVIHRLDRPWSLVDMGLSHRGDRLAFSSPSGGKFGTVVRILDLAAPANAREIFRSPPGSSVAAHAWSLDDREVIVERDVNASGSDDDKSHVWAVDVARGKARPIGLTVDRGLHKLQISPDGRYLSYDAGWPYQEVWVLENAVAGLAK